ncbi:hypothetical protein KC335_g10276, partial [Hortaea werneckii]
MSSSSRQRSASHRSHTPEDPTRNGTPPQHRQNLGVPTGIVLNDIPSSGYGDASSLLRPQLGYNSPYPPIAGAPTSAPYATSPRPRAHTFTDPSIQATQQQEHYRRGTPVNSGGGMHQGSAWQLPGARHFSEQQRAGPGQYVPPPPPPPVQTPGSQGMHLPGPPPRPAMSANAQTQMMMPPPPNQPSGYNNWMRSQGYPPPPPVQQQPREPRTYDPTAYAEYMQLPPLNDNAPLTSATYIPGGESFGPGVGIPPLHSQNSMNQHHQQGLQAPSLRPGIQQQNSYYRGASGDFTAAADLASQPRYGGDATFSHDPNQSWFSTASYQQYQQPQPVHSHSVPPPSLSSYPPPTPTSSQKKLVEPAAERQAHASPAQAHNPHSFGPPSSNRGDDSSSQGNREHSSSGETPASPQDQNWPLERVQIWLAAHGFSKEWQAAFQHLNVHGALFLDIGRSGGQRNIGFMPQT